MKILIYGGGAVGLGLASFLIPSGAQVKILARQETAEALRERGLRRTGIFGEYHAPPAAFAVHSTLDVTPDVPDFDFILVCVKSFDTAAAAADLARHPHLFNSATRVILCQNGWGNHERFLEQLALVPLYSARVITGFRRPRENEVDITVHADAMRVGSLGGEPLGPLRPLCAAIAAAGFPCEVTPHVERDLWAKMLYNCALNPLGAIFGVPYGALGESEHARAIMDAIHDEVFAVMRAAGHETHWPDAAAYRAAFYGHEIPATAAHHSSTLQDLRAGKRTEIEALSGAIVELGARHGIPVPVNGMLYRMVKFEEEKNNRGKKVT